MRNKLGSFYPYLALIGKLCLSCLFAGLLVVIVIYAIPKRWTTWAWAIPLAAVCGYLAFMGLYSVLSNIKDIIGGRTIMTGTVNDKYTDQTPLPYGAASLNYKITVEGVPFEVSKKIYDWLSIGDEVHISYWPNTKKLYRTDK